MYAMKQSGKRVEAVDANDPVQPKHLPGLATSSYCSNSVGFWWEREQPSWSPRFSTYAVQRTSASKCSVWSMEYEHANHQPHGERQNAAWMPDPRLIDKLVRMESTLAIRDDGGLRAVKDRRESTSPFSFHSSHRWSSFYSLALVLVFHKDVLSFSSQR